MKDRGRRRKLNFVKAKRKKEIAQHLYGGDKYEHDGQYIKNKVHCSCPFCTPKTNNRGGYGKPMWWRHSDELKILSMDCQMNEYLAATTG